jgi:TRAP-type mannitol/chloroaromatic compound transport system substrate-binding protein
MKRRELLGKAAKLAAVGAAAGAAVACGEAGPAAGGPAVKTKRRIQWRLASSFPRGLDTIFGTAEDLAQLVDTMTEGRFTIRPYPAGELVPALGVLDAVQQETVQVGQTASYYYTGKDPSLAFDTALPFGLTARQHAAWLLEGGGQDLLRPIFADFNIVQHFAGSTGAQMGGWFNREIRSVEDIQGLKMRIPGQGGAVMSRLGATVQVIGGGDIYPALERGAIDATEWIGPYDDEKLGFHQVAKYYYYPGWWEPGPGLSFYVSRTAWESLAADDQAIFRCAALAAGSRMQAKYDALNPAAFARLLASGTQVLPFPQDVMVAARAESDALTQELAGANPRFRSILTPWTKFRDESFAWFATAELAYEQFAFTKGTPA